MKLAKIFLTLISLFALAVPFSANADNASYSGAGGTFTTGTAAGQAISVQGSPLAGTNAAVSFSCPITFFGAGTYQWNWSCAGGSMTIAASDKSVALTGSFSSGTMTYSGSGGGRGGHTTYWYLFTGSYTGMVTLAGHSQSVYGSISTVLKTSTQVGSSGAPLTSLSLGWDSAYSPVVVGDSGNGRLLGADNVTGANLVKYGSWGSGTGQFEAIAGLAHDASGRIYVTDSSLDRLVRIDDLTGKDWAQLGSHGVGSLHFNQPLGVAVDSAGKVWVADAGNHRIVRFDDMTGKNWTAFGTLGTAVKEFSAPAAIAFDTLGRIYVADSGNNRLVRFDDLTGKNWTTLSTINIGVYGYTLAGVNSVAVVPSGKIYVATPGGWLFRVDDMTGANGEASSWSPSISDISADSSGAVFVAGGFTPGVATTLDAVGTGYFGGNLGQTGLQPSAVLAAKTSTPPPAAPMLSATALAFGSRNVGEPGTAQHITVRNLGGAALAITSISASADFKLTNTCTAPVPGGGVCSVAVQFDPVATGTRAATLSIASNSVHPVLDVALSGTGTAPKAVVLPGALTYQAQQTGTASGLQSVTLTNTGSGPLTIISIAATGDFSVTSNCPAVVVAGSGCTLSVGFKPVATGTRTGSLTITDDAPHPGSQQVVTLTGSGISAAAAFTLSPESLLFPNQQVAVTSSAQVVTLKNSSTAKVALTAPAFPAGFKGSTTCGTALAAGASCGIQVEFAPTALGPLTGAVTVPITGHPSLSFGVAGTGVQSAVAALTISPGAVAFGAIQIGDNPDMNLTIANPSRLAVGIRSTALSGSAAFSVIADNCPVMLAAGTSCTMQIGFVPTTTATYTGTLTVVEASGAKTPVILSGSASVNGN